MKIFVGQIYIKPGVSFPFSLRFQKWLGDALTQRVVASEVFRNAYSDSFSLGLRISAKDDIDQTEIKGPTVFKRDKSVEFTIFLPHRVCDYNEPECSLGVLRLILRSAVLVLEELGLDAAKVKIDSSALEDDFLNTPGLLDAPKSPTPRG